MSLLSFCVSHFWHVCFSRAHGSKDFRSWQVPVECGSHDQSKAWIWSSQLSRSSSCFNNHHSFQHRQSNRHQTLAQSPPSSSIYHSIIEHSLEYIQPLQHHAFARAHCSGPAPYIRFSARQLFQHGPIHSLLFVALTRTLLSSLHQLSKTAHLPQRCSAIYLCHAG